MKKKNKNKKRKVNKKRSIPKLQTIYKLGAKDCKKRLGRKSKTRKRKNRRWELIRSEESYDSFEDELAKKDPKMAVAPCIYETNIRHIQYTCTNTVRNSPWPKDIGRFINIYYITCLVPSGGLRHFAARG